MDAARIWVDAVQLAMPHQITQIERPIAIECHQIGIAGRVVISYEVLEDWCRTRHVVGLNIAPLIVIWVALPAGSDTDLIAARTSCLHLLCRLKVLADDLSFYRATKRP